MKFYKEKKPILVKHDNGAHVGKFVYDPSWKEWRFVMENEMGLSIGHMKDILRFMRKMKWD